MCARPGGVQTWCFQWSEGRAGGPGSAGGLCSLCLRGRNGRGLVKEKPGRAAPQLLALYSLVDGQAWQ